VHVGSHAPEISPVTVEPVTPPSDDDDDDDDDTVIGSQTSSISPSGSRSNQPAQDVFASVSDIPDDRLARTIALVLTDFCKSTSSEQPGFPEPHDPAALFFSPFRQKTFTLDFYCKRLLQYTYCSKSCFVVAILYLVRLSERFPVFELNDYNVHRLICTAVVLAAKFVDDTSFSNVHYAKVAGIQSPGEMNKLEAFMLKALDYRLFVSQESYREVEAQIAMIARECA
jgi:Cyclin